jgi:cytochrome c-type biogenesis protein CcmF
VNGALGHTGVLLGFAAAVVGIIVLGIGLARGRQGALRGGRLYAPVILLGGVVAVVAMQRALISHDFSLNYVADNNSRTTPLIYSITGMWSALAGSILLWGVILGGYATALVWRFRARATDTLVAWATLVMYGVAAFFFALMLGPADPFRHVAGTIPTDGLGPNVLLQDNPLVLFHPPMLYLGLVGFTVPFAFAVASLITGRLDEDWQGETRRWTLFAWSFLTLGIVLGAWWSYQVLGWGGFWAWDPVENASLLPWLVGTAYLHSVMVSQRRGILRVWNLSLVVATFSLTILGTFLTRSGVIQSVHAFSTSTVGPLLLGFFGAVIALGVGLIAWRGDRLRSVGGIDSPLSREGAFLANNLLFVLFAFVVLLGTVFPLLYEAVASGSQVAVGAPYFNRLTIPIALALLFLMAVAPALPWRKTTTTVLRGRLAVPAALGVVTIVACVIGGIHGIEPLLAFGLGAFAAGSAGRALFLSVRAAWRGARAAGQTPGRAALAGWRGLVGRANGGMIVHIGIVLLAVGMTGATAFGQRGTVVLDRGATGYFAGHSVTFSGTRVVHTPSHTSRQAVLVVDGGGTFTPAITRFGAGTQPVGTPAVDSSWRSDVYLTINSIPDRGGAWTFGVVVQPLVMWLWIGGALVVIGSVLAAVPGRRRRPTDPVSAGVGSASIGSPGTGSPGKGSPGTGSRRTSSSATTAKAADPTTDSGEGSADSVNHQPPGSREPALAKEPR